MTILADSREPNIIPKQLGELAVVVTLPHGDYQFYGRDGLRICIERKEMGDLLNSLAEKRLQRQLREILDSGAETILLVEGFITTTKDFKVRIKTGETNWNYAAVMDFLLSAQLSGVRVLFSPNQGSTIELLKYLHNYYQKDSHKALLARPRPLFAFDDKREKQLYFLMGLPLVGEKRAGDILDYFGSPAEPIFFPERLKEVSGIGQKIVDRWVEVLGFNE